MNIPPGNVNIPSSKFKLPHCKLNEFYPFDNDQIRRKITLKIYTGNDEESKNLVIRKPNGNLFLMLKNMLWSKITNIHSTAKQ